MQRIDENTYIDDTLITCAEYQLFIDEMRGQMKYYQPDHWNSYEYTRRQARECVLGVRSSDAKAFCEWLTERDRGKWSYRLPTDEEIKDFPLRSLERSSLGYWVNDEHQFAWVGHIPKDARGIDFRGIGDQALKLALNIILDRNFDINIDLDRALARATGSAPIRSLDLEYTLDRTFSHVSNRELILVSILPRNFNYGPYSALLNDFDSALRSDFAKAIAAAVNRASASDFDSRPADKTTILFATVFDFYFDIFTLQERIAGRSPAFEGIRIVKEQIR